MNKITNFQLEKKSVGKVLTCFKVTDDKGAVYGSMNVPNGAVHDFVAHWKGAPIATAINSRAQPPR